MHSYPLICGCYGASWWLRNGECGRSPHDILKEQPTSNGPISAGVSICRGGMMQSYPSICGCYRMTLVWLRNGEFAGWKSSARYFD